MANRDPHVSSKPLWGPCGVPTSAAYTPHACRRGASASEMIWSVLARGRCMPRALKLAKLARGLVAGIRHRTSKARVNVARPIGEAPQDANSSRAARRKTHHRCAERRNFEGEGRLGERLPTWSLRADWGSKIENGPW